MITVVGSANIDLVLRVPGLPLRGETVPASSLMRTMGGKGANQAVAAARAGSDVRLVACLGNDAAGEELRTSLAAAGVGTEYVRMDETQATGTALITVDDNGDNTVVVFPGSNYALTPFDVDAASEALQSSAIVVLQLEIPPGTALHAARLAQKAGALVLLNPAPARRMDPAILSVTDILIPNEEEVARLTGVGSPVEPVLAARLLLDTGVKTVIVTLGARGATVVSSGEETDVLSYAVQSVDSTGAGDAFVGNLASALDRGQALTDAVQFATAAAALSVQVEGAQRSMPFRSETEALVRGEFR